MLRDPESISAYAWHTCSALHMPHTSSKQVLNQTKETANRGAMYKRNKRNKRNNTWHCTGEIKSISLLYLHRDGVTASQCVLFRGSGP